VSNSLGDQLIAVLKADGSAPAVALLQHIVAANGDIAADEKAVAEFLADGASVGPTLFRDLNFVLLGWTLQRVIHWLGANPPAPTAAPAPVQQPAPTVGPTVAAPAATPR
jgi:hypothetical protein